MLVANYTGNCLKFRYFNQDEEAASDSKLAPTLPMNDIFFLKVQENWKLRFSNEQYMNQSNALFFQKMTRSKKFLE